tara:strand:- start:2021 stop:2272 length:252 start_codon:yes stop_codon:yes gene_type:complete
MNWKEYVADFKESYTCESYISEYIDSILPVYYSDIAATFDDMAVLINEEHIGLPIWQVMNGYIYDDYYNAFMEEWNGFEEEEE